MSDKFVLPNRLEIAALVALKAQLLAITPIPSKLSLSCSQVQFISAAGAQLLVAFVNMLRASGSVVMLEGLKDEVKADLKIMGLHELTEELA